MLNVLDLGARGDGVTDDTEPIQVGLASGQALYFPTGRYACRPLYLPSGAVMSGPAGGANLYTPQAAAILILRDGAEGDLLSSAVPTREIVVQDLVLMGNKAHNLSGSGIRADNWHQFQLRNLSLRQFAEHGFVQDGTGKALSATGWGIVENVHANQNNGDGFHILNEPEIQHFDHLIADVSGGYGFFARNASGLVLRHVNMGVNGLGGILLGQSHHVMLDTIYSEFHARGEAQHYEGCQYGQFNMLQCNNNTTSAMLLKDCERCQFHNISIYSGASGITGLKIEDSAPPYGENLVLGLQVGLDGPNTVGLDTTLGLHWRLSGLNLHAAVASQGGAGRGNVVILDGLNF